MKDYRVTVKVRNNRILKAIERVGGVPGGKWATANGICYQTLNNFINMTDSPINSSGGLRTFAIKLCDILNATPDDLWSSEQLYPLEKNFSEMEMSYGEVVALLPSAEQTYLLDESGVEQRQARAALDKVIGTLNQNQQDVLKYRFEDDMIYGEIANKMGLSSERVRQIEAKALRMLRQPIRAADIIDCAVDCAEVSAFQIKRIKGEKAASERRQEALEWSQDASERRRARLEAGHAWRCRVENLK